MGTCASGHILHKAITLLISCFSSQNFQYGYSGRLIRYSRNVTSKRSDPSQDKVTVWWPLWSKQDFDIRIIPNSNFHFIYDFLP